VPDPINKSASHCFPLNQLNETLLDAKEISIFNDPSRLTHLFLAEEEEEAHRYHQLTNQRHPEPWLH
jgi:hypothetical protein